ncbi:DNA-processing protein DprA [Candidatus Dojkabacteria bacterium]|uniref:DNA-processing protein DprA n=1 Tax=Candidatus Dojkabacteria bacterium TaxID=2099670 RepID=A0A955L7X5_9BACT|nr:DNA-processing protein DprA [Candidatus Dojkabacteria bacterium]
MDLEEKIARLYVSHVPKIGPKTFQEILKFYPSIVKIFEQDKRFLIEQFGQTLGKSLYSLRYEYDTKKLEINLEKYAINFTVFGDSDYPDSLESLSDPPICLYYKGNLSSIDFSRSLAIVGTRKITEYGRSITRKITEGLVNKGFVIVSGMAYGVDSIAHQVALSRGGKTIAVLASSAHLPTPVGNTKLYTNILSGDGAIISENYISDKITPGSFPRRNRIIAGCTLGTIVVEAGIKSGACITANIAFSEGRHVFAIPGNVGKTQSEGTNKLIKDSKAKLIESVDDILVEFDYILESVPTSDKNKWEGCSKKEQEILQVLGRESYTMEGFSRVLELSTSDLGAILSMLEIRGLIAKGKDARFRLIL